MAWTPLLDAASDMPEWRCCGPLEIDRSVQDEDDDGRYRNRKERIPSACGRRAGQVLQRFVAARTAQANQIRGLLSEFGILVRKGIGCLTARFRRFWRMGRTAYRTRAGNSSRGCLLISGIWTVKSASSRSRSTPGIGSTQTARDWRRFPASGHLPQAH